MAEALTIARPYAQAAFKFASTHSVLGDWSSMLSLMAAVADDTDVRALIDSPRLSESQLAELFIQIGGEHINEKFANFIRVLSENRRLSLLPEIAALFEIQRQQAEGAVQAELITAFPASEAQQQRIRDSLSKRLGRDIELTCTTDSSLLGGAIVRAGDLVIDGSVRGKLERLGSALSH